MAECERHEALLNIAFADPDFWLLCPYDTVALDERVVEEARRNHPFVREHDASHVERELSGSRRAHRAVRRATSGCAARRSTRHVRSTRSLPTCARLVARLSPPRPGSPRNGGRALVLAVHEVAANSVAHGHGRGTLRVWRDPTEVVCEVRDDGRVADPLVGRARPGLNGEGGRGLWIANQLCELVQLRSFATETVVRLHMRHRLIPPLSGPDPDHWFLSAGGAGEPSHVDRPRSRPRVDVGQRRDRAGRRCPVFPVPARRDPGHGRRRLAVPHRPRGQRRRASVRPRHRDRCRARRRRTARRRVARPPLALASGRARRR